MRRLPASTLFECQFCSCSLQHNCMTAPGVEQAHPCADCVAGNSTSLRASSHNLATRNAVHLSTICLQATGTHFGVSELRSRTKQVRGDSAVQQPLSSQLQPNEQSQHKATSTTTSYCPCSTTKTIRGFAWDRRNQNLRICACWHGAREAAACRYTCTILKEPRRALPRSREPPLYFESGYIQVV